MVMSLVSFIGPKPNLLDINNINRPMRLEVSQPVLDFKDMAKMRSIENYSFEQVQVVRARHLLIRSRGARKGSRRALASLSRRP